MGEKNFPQSVRFSVKMSENFLVGALAPTPPCSYATDEWKNGQNDFWRIDAYLETINEHIKEVNCDHLGGQNC